ASSSRSWRMAERHPDAEAATKSSHPIDPSNREVKWDIHPPRPSSLMHLPPEFGWGRDGTCGLEKPPGGSPPPRLARPIGAGAGWQPWNEEAERRGQVAARPMASL